MFWCWVLYDCFSLSLGMFPCPKKILKRLKNILLVVLFHIYCFMINVYKVSKLTPFIFCSAWFIWDYMVQNCYKSVLWARDFPEMAYNNGEFSHSCKALHYVWIHIKMDYTEFWTTDILQRMIQTDSIYILILLYIMTFFLNALERHCCY